jgi:hypothetical protein
MTQAEAPCSGEQRVVPHVTIFETVGASAIGSSHLAAGKLCEDFFKLEPGNDWIVAVVSDGAGSATRAIDGATIVSEEICRTFKARLSAQTCRDNIQTDTFSSWVELGACEGIESARKRCLGEIREYESLADFHATVVGAVMVGEDGAVFHIGDGCASAHRNTSSGGVETIAFSEPENGEYVNETFFFTESWWRQHLRISKICGVADEVWLMTDGAYDLVVPPNQKRLREFTVSEINRLVFSEPISNRPAVLAEILSSPQAQRSNDDKTIVIVRRLQPSD